MKKNQKNFMIKIQVYKMKFLNIKHIKMNIVKELKTEIMKNIKKKLKNIIKNQKNKYQKIFLMNQINILQHILKSLQEKSKKKMK